MGDRLAWLFDLLIAVLEEAKAWGVAEQIGATFAAIAFVLSPGLAVWRWMKGRESRLAKDAALAERDLIVATRSLAELREENERLARLQPDRVLGTLEFEKRDGNSRKLVVTADEYMSHHRDCFAEACRILANHHLSRYEDGAAALHRARAAAMGAIAADPEDKDQLFLLYEIEALQRVEAATPETEHEVREAEERARLRTLLREEPDDVEALRAVGWREFDAGRYRVAIGFWERALEAALAEGFGYENAMRLSIQVDLGYATLRAGRLAVARKAIIALPGLGAKATGPTDPLTLRARRLWSDLHMNEEKWGDAERILRELLPLCEAAQGKESPDTLLTRRDLALAINGQGHAQEAEGMLRDLLPLWEKVLGREHPAVLNTRHALATAILNQGRAEEAEGQFHDLLGPEETVWGGEHPNSLATQYSLGLAILHQGRSQEAEDLFRDLLPLDERVLGSEHPGTLLTRCGLARAILSQGRAQEAESMLRDLLPLREKVLGKEHPATLSARRELAWAALEQGAADRARAALAPLPKDGGDPHPLPKGTTAMLRGWLADLDGDAARAEVLLDQAEALLVHLDRDHYIRRRLARYRETRVPGKPGGTAKTGTVAPVDNSRPPGKLE